MAIQSRTFVYAFSRLKEGRVDISTKFIRATSKDRALAAGRKVFRPLLDDIWSDEAVEVYRA